MLLDDPYLWRHPGAALAAAFLTALTITTVLELMEQGRKTSSLSAHFVAQPAVKSGTGTLLDAFGLPQQTSITTGVDSGVPARDDRVAAEFIASVTSSREDVVRAGVMLENAFQQVDLLISSTQKALDSTGREISRLERVRARETPLADQQQDTDSAGSSQHSKEERLHSGYLQLFESIAFCEKLIASRLDIKSVSHHEKRAWRQRIMGVLHQGDTSALGGLVGQREKIEYLENRLTAVLSKWGQNFKKATTTSNDEASSPTHILEMDEVGYEPIYRSLFAVDAKAPASEEEGIRLHQLYNAPQGR